MKYRWGILFFIFFALLAGNIAMSTGSGLPASIGDAMRNIGLASVLEEDDAVALNNKAVTRYQRSGSRGVGARYNSDVAEQLRDAALAGSGRAVENLIYAFLPNCQETATDNQRFMRETLEPLIAAGNPQITEFWSDCETLISLGHSGWQEKRCEILDYWAGKNQDGFRIVIAAEHCGSVATQKHLGEARSSRLYYAEKTYDLILQAAERDEPNGYLLFDGIAGYELVGLLRETPSGSKLSSTHPIDLLIEGGERGCWRCMCHAAREIFNGMTIARKGSMYTRENAMTAARKCEEGAETHNPDYWRQGKEYQLFKYFQLPRADMLVASAHRARKRYQQFAAQHAGTRN